MSSRLRPQEFELSLEKSKHTERCAECVTQPTRMLARLTAAVARILKGPAWHKTPRHGRYAEHFNGEPVRGGVVPHRSDALGRYSGAAGIWVLPSDSHLPWSDGPWRTRNLAMGYPIPTSSRARVGAIDVSSQTKHIIRVSQVGVSEQKQISLPRVCRLFLNLRCGNGKFRRWRNHHAASQRECARASLSKSNHGRRRGGAFCFGDAKGQKVR
jgi:hypothetical protein